MPPTCTVHFHFAGIHGRPGICAIERIALSDGRTLMIATEIEENPGASITNAAELIATQVCQRYAIEPTTVVWIEPYPPDRAHGKTPDWDMMNFHHYATWWSLASL